jgi:hypothetical protein
MEPLAMVVLGPEATSMTHLLVAAMPVLPVLLVPPPMIRQLQTSSPAL